MSFGKCATCGAPYNEQDIHCTYCGCLIEERVKALSSFPTVEPTLAIDNDTGERIYDQASTTTFGSGNLLSTVVFLAIGIFVVAIIAPVAIQQLVQQSTFQNLPPNVVFTFTAFVPIVFVIVVVLLAVRTLHNRMGSSYS